MNLIRCLEQVKTSVQLLELLKRECEFVSMENEQDRVHIQTHAWKDYAIYYYEGHPRLGICPVEYLSTFVKLKSS
ncbi:hypothetical protein [Bacillus xiapuensis]|uniref:hypothetical protein n=1 Tax=Bacillus xiapuensis TaxID=2014075 RepID=UPI000C2452EB|nr:hypothetical protein [Bacillus xiapuensis]